MADEQGTRHMIFYGVGNHGGGPTIANIQSVNKLRAEYGNDRILLSSPDAYFEEMAGSGQTFPVVEDDLQHHASGCYSTHSESKAYNRKSEHRLLNAEKFGAIAGMIAGLRLPGPRNSARLEKRHVQPISRHYGRLFH